MDLSLSPETAAQVAKEVGVHRQLLGTDSAASINRSHLAELADAYRRAMLYLEHERKRAEDAERRAEQMTNWWAGVSQQLRNIQHEWQAEKHAAVCDTPDDCRH